MTNASMRNVRKRNASMNATTIDSTVSRQLSPCGSAPFALAAASVVTLGEGGSLAAEGATAGVGSFFSRKFFMEFPCDRLSASAATYVRRSESHSPDRHAIHRDRAKTVIHQ